MDAPIRPLALSLFFLLSAASGCGRPSSTAEPPDATTTTASSATAVDGARTDASLATDAATDVDASARFSTPPQVPPTGPLVANNNRATLSGKPFPEFEGPGDDVASVRKSIPVKYEGDKSTGGTAPPKGTPPNFSVGRAFLLSDHKGDSPRYLVVKVESRGTAARCGVKMVGGQFNDAKGKPVGGGHNLMVVGSMGDNEVALKGSRLVIPNVGAWLSAECLSPGESGYFVLDMNNEADCAATHPCAPKGGDLASFEFTIWSDAYPVVGPKSQVLPTGYAVAGDRVSLVGTNKGPGYIVPVTAKGLALDASDDPLFFMTFAVSAPQVVAPGATFTVTDVPTYRGVKAKKMLAWVTFAESTSK